MTDQLDAHIPPHGYRPVVRRLARSYGPLAVAALLLILMALLVPTRSTERAPEDGSSAGETERGLVVSHPVAEVTVR